MNAFMEGIKEGIQPFLWRMKSLLQVGETNISRQVIFAEAICLIFFLVRVRGRAFRFRAVLCSSNEWSSASCDFFAEIWIYRLVFPTDEQKNGIALRIVTFCGVWRVLFPFFLQHNRFGSLLMRKTYIKIKFERLLQQYWF